MSIAITLWEKYCCAIELRRFGGVAQRRTFPQDAQKVRPARPQPMKAPEA
jgi:hypothetical protein